ncbi:hypothetical protein PG984_003826 [Apiospora sp. TS-2023a]
MPIFRGIDVSIVASAEAKKLPEYPHPDSASVILTDGDPTCQKKVKPRISVYIPSMPGEQFWLKYSSSHLYFKMLMNGRPITSWGISMKSDKDGNPERPIRGTVVRALYEPRAQSQDKDLGTGAREIGIETRYFHFMAGLDKKSAAEDGGLIEVQIFRSKGRKRRAPKLPEFRDQDRYGITSPSGGLVENPQDATFYDWLLVDPKDSPLCNLLLPLSINEEPRSAESHPTVGKPTIITANRFGCSPQEKSPSNSPGMEDDDPCKSDFAFGVEPSELFAFDGTAHVPSDNHQGSTTPSQYCLKYPLQGLSVADSSAASRHSSYSSLKSNCPSLTPSLAQYVDDGEFGDDNVAIGMARTVVSSAPSMVMLAMKGTKGGDSGSLSDYEHSPPSSTASDSQGHPEPGAYLTTTGSVLERHIAQLSSPFAARTTEQPDYRRIPISVSEEAIPRRPTPLDHESLGLADSLWIRRTPSPTPKKSIGRFWSPRLHKKSTKQEFDRRGERKRHSDSDRRFSRELKAWTFDENPIMLQAVGPIDGTSNRRAGIVIPSPTFHGGFVGNIENDVSPRTEFFDKRNTWELCKEPPTGNWI